MGEGGDWWSGPIGVIVEGILRGCQGLFTPVSLGYPISVFNKKLYSERKKERKKSVWGMRWATFDRIGVLLTLIRQGRPVKPSEVKIAFIIARKEIMK